MSPGSQRKVELWPESGQVSAFPCLGRNILMCLMWTSHFWNLLSPVKSQHHVCKMKTISVCFIRLLRGLVRYTSKWLWGFIEVISSASERDWHFRRNYEWDQNRSPYSKIYSTMWPNYRFNDFSLVKPFDTILVLMILVCRKYGEVDFLRKYESNTERP